MRFLKKCSLVPCLKKLFNFKDDTYRYTTIKREKRTTVFYSIFALIGIGILHLKWRELDEIWNRTISFESASFLSLLNCDQDSDLKSHDGSNLNSGHRKGLVIAVVGDYSHHSEWLVSNHGTPAVRTWDLAVIYYGEDDSFSCDECIIVVQNQGAKWDLIYDLISKEKMFEDLSKNYDMVAFFDDDLKMSMEKFNAYFCWFKKMDLIMAQPSLCRGSSSSWKSVVQQRYGLFLHYTNFVELMAPTFSSRFFEDIVRETLKDQFTGWGMDMIWPFLAGWPKNKIGIFDFICMHHVKNSRKSRLYDINLPFSEHEEWEKNLERFNFTSDKADAAGMAYNRPIVLSELHINEVTCTETNSDTATN